MTISRDLRGAAMMQWLVQVVVSQCCQHVQALTHDPLL